MSVVKFKKDGRSSGDPKVVVVLRREDSIELDIITSLGYLDSSWESSSSS